MRPAPSHSRTPKCAFHPLRAPALRLSHWPKHITWPRPREWRNGPPLLDGRSCKVTLQRMCGHFACRWCHEKLGCAQYHAGHMSFPPAPRMLSVMLQHHGEQKDLWLSYQTYVGNDRCVGEEAELQGDWVAWPHWASASTPELN